MKPIERGELLDLAAYEGVREHFRRRIMQDKRVRRVAIGDHLMLLFENRDTVLFQIQEMLRTERITKEPAVLHELETYNALVPGPCELSATAFIEYPDVAERDRMLVLLAGIEQEFFVRVGAEVMAAVGEERGARTDRTTAVHYLKFPLTQAARRGITATAAGAAGAPEVYLGVRHPELTLETRCSTETLRSLAEDLDG